MEQSVNTITLRGELDALPIYSHENHGKKFYRFILNIPRLSGTVDQIPIVAQERILNDMELSGGQMLSITGQIRSHNVRTDGIRRLLIFVFATQISSDDADAENKVHLEGVLCRDPIYRRTPLGREICDVMLAVPRGFGRADYLPCILWGSTAQEISTCVISDKISIDGRLQSRIYKKQTETGIEERVAYEISALNAQILTQED